MKQKTLQTLYRYWNEVRAGRLAPQRLEIEPSSIAGILSETFMLERVDAATFNYRLAGTRLCELFGAELRGSNFLEGWNARDRILLDRLLAAVCSQGAAAHLTFEAGADVRSRAEIDAILLPLLHGGNTIGRVIGAMSPTSQPDWLERTTLHGRRLLRQEVIWPDGRPYSLIAKSRNQTPLAPAMSGLRIVKSDRRQFRVLDGGLAKQEKS